MKRALEEVHTVGVQLQYVTLSDDNDCDDFGTADALRQLQEKIKVGLFYLCHVIDAIDLIQVFDVTLA